jgi:acetyltransferase-like isoleucine patch superfamily enzyme
MSLKLRAYGAKIGKNVIFKPPIEFYYPQALCIGDNTIVHEYVTFKSEANGKIIIGKNCKINKFNHIEGGMIRIGDDTWFGPSVHITDGDHGFAKGELIRKQPAVSKPVTIESDVWLGAKVIVLKGTRIGKGSVVGAGSVVTKSIPPYSVAVGVPARVIKKRT